jgi:hypothetical protein
LADWIGAHTRAFEAVGGVAHLIVPDNTKTAVIKACLYEPTVNRTYAEMAAHYDTAILPARPRKPHAAPNRRAQGPESIAKSKTFMQISACFQTTPQEKTSADKLQPRSTRSFNPTKRPRRHSVRGTRTYKTP